MKKRKLISMVLAATLALTSLTGCGKKDSSSDDSVLRVGMECAYAPFNWQTSTKTDTSVKLGKSGYADGYDVQVAKKIAKKLGKKLKSIIKDEEKVKDLLENNFDKVINDLDIGIRR